MIDAQVKDEVGSSPLSEPNIFEYDDFRLFLHATYLFLKQSTRNFSFRYFSKRAGFSSPNFLKLVMEGKRNLSADSIPKFTRALKMPRAESDFFSLLVHFNQARDASERADYAKRILQSKGYQKMYPLKQAEFSYYASWYYVTIRELTALVDFREDPRWISEKIFPKISEIEAARALKDLEALGLLRRDDSGRLQQSARTVTTANEVVSTSILQYHKDMLLRASESIESVPRTHREFSAACVPVSEEAALKIKTMIQEFRSEVLRIAEGDAKPDRIYQLNLQLFPMTQWDREDEA